MSTAMDLIAQLRQRLRVKPRVVMVELVADGLRQMPQDVIDPHFGGIVWLDIPRSTPISEIDFRPLVGLNVHLSDSTSDPTRLRSAAKAIAEVEPALMCVFVQRDGVTTMHRRFAGSPPTQDAFQL
jgi:hypothetical protein